MNRGTFGFPGPRAADAPSAVVVPPNRNILHNPSGLIIQRGATGTVADDAYTADRWYALTQTNTISFALVATPENGFAVGTRLTQTQVVAQRIGYAQIVEGNDCKDRRGGTVTFAPRVRASSSQSIRYAICEWTGTEDAVTSDIVNDWTSPTYTPGNFFIAANLNVLAIGVSNALSGAFTTLPAITATVGASATNLIVFVWTEAVAAQNVTLDFSYNKLEAGAVLTDFVHRAIAEEMAICQRYFCKTFTYGTAPAQAAGFAGSLVAVASGTAQLWVNFEFKQAMRIVPTITTFNPVSANGNWRNVTGSTDITVSVTNIGTGRAQIVNSGAVTDGAQHMIHATATADL